MFFCSFLALGTLFRQIPVLVPCSVFPARFTLAHSDRGFDVNVKHDAKVSTFRVESNGEKSTKAKEEEVSDLQVLGGPANVDELRLEGGTTDEETVDVGLGGCCDDLRIDRLVSW